MSVIKWTFYYLLAMHMKSDRKAELVLSCRMSKNSSRLYGRDARVSDIEHQLLFKIWVSCALNLGYSCTIFSLVWKPWYPWTIVSRNSHQIRTLTADGFCLGFLILWGTINCWYFCIKQLPATERGYLNESHVPSMCIAHLIIKFS